MGDLFLAHQGDGQVAVATYPSKDFTGTPEAVEKHDIAEYKNEWDGPADKSPRSIRYTAKFKADKTGKYMVLAAASGSGPLHCQRRRQADRRAERRLKASTPSSLRLISAPAQTINVVAGYLPGFQGNRFGLAIVDEAGLLTDDVKKIASAADVAVVAVGFDPSNESEGLDRTFTLPWGQDAAD